MTINVDAIDRFVVVSIAMHRIASHHLAIT